MAVVLTKSRQWRPRLSIPRLAEDHPSLTHLRLFCTDKVSDPVPDPAPIPDPIIEKAQSLDSAPKTATLESPKPVTARRKTIGKPAGPGKVKGIIVRGKQIVTPPGPEKVEDIICRIMSNRPWTTRMQNTIRSLVPTFDHNLVWNVLCGSRKAEHALQFYRWVERSGRFRHNRETHLKIIEILSKDSKLNHARLILLDMPKRGVVWDEEHFIHLMEGYGKAGIVQESVKIFDKMKDFGVKRTLKSYDAFFKIILKRGRNFMAKRYFNKMLSEGIEPTRTLYNFMIWGFFLSESPLTAMHFYKGMKKRNMMPDVVTYNTMIYGYIRSKKMDEAEKYFKMMKENKITPTVISYTTMIKGYLDVGKSDDGLRMFQEMKSNKIKPTSVTYSTLLPGLCNAGKMAECRDLLKEMSGKLLAPRDSSIFSKLLSGQCKAGDLDAAADVLKAMARLGVPRESGHYGTLMENFCKAGLYDRAVKLLNVVIKNSIVLRPHSSTEIEASAYNPMVEYLCSNGKTENAEVFVRQLMQKGVLDPVALNNLIRGHTKEGKPGSASEIFNIMKRRGVVVDVESFKSLVNGYLISGEPADAKTALDSMIETGYTPDASLFRSAIEALLKDERVQTASRVMKSMVEKGVMENMDLADQILEALLFRGHVEEAIGRIDMLTKGGYEVKVNDLLSVLCGKRKTIAALKLTYFCLEREGYALEMSTYDMVLDALVADGKTLRAYSVVNKIRKKEGRDSVTWSGLGDLIATLNNEGNTQQSDVLARLIASQKAGKRKKKCLDA